MSRRHTTLPGRDPSPDRQGPSQISVVRPQPGRWMRPCGQVRQQRERVRARKGDHAHAARLYGTDRPRAGLV